MRRRPGASLVALLAALALTWQALGPTAAALNVDVSLGGGSVMAWSTPALVGNGFGVGVHIGGQALAVGLVAAVALPDSRVLGTFGVTWLEGRWAPLGRRGVLSPYVAVGLGVVSGDGVPARVTGSDAEPLRWAGAEPSPLVVFGAGVRYGDPQGLGVALDLRAYGASYGGLSLLASYTF